MKTFQEVIGSKLDAIDNKLSDNARTVADTFLGEAGNISSGFALRKQGNIIRNGKRVLSDRDATDADKMLAKMMVDLSGLCMLSIAASGGGSALSTIAKGAALKSI